MKKQIIEILSEICPGIDFETETALIDDHILESFDIVSLVAAQIGQNVHQFLFHDKYTS